MAGLPKLLFLVLLAVAVWYVVGQLNRARRAEVSRTRPRPGPARATASQAGAAPKVEDLVVCAVCGTYTAADAPGCGKAGCPRPR